MTIEEIDELLRTDEEDRYVNLVIPEDKLGPAMNLIGKKRRDLNDEEIFRVRRYAGKLYEEAEE